MLLAGGAIRPGGNMSRKDTNFYKKEKQIAGSLRTGWEPCQSDLGGPFFIPQPQCAVGFVHRTAGWLAGHRRSGSWWAIETATPQEEPVLTLSPAACPEAWSRSRIPFRLSFPADKKKIRILLPSYHCQRDDTSTNRFELSDERCSINLRPHQL